MHLAVNIKFYNNFMLQCSIALAITVIAFHIQQPTYKTEEDLNCPNNNTNYIKEKLSLCTSGRLMGGGIASHILNLGTAWRKVVSLTSTIIGHNKCVLDFKLSPCFEYCMYSFGYFPGVRLLFADVSEPSISSIFKGWMLSMKCG